MGNQNECMHVWMDLDEVQLFSYWYECGFRGWIEHVCILEQVVLISTLL